MMSQPEFVQHHHHHHQQHGVGSHQSRYMNCPHSGYPHASGVGAATFVPRPLSSSVFCTGNGNRDRPAHSHSTSAESEGATSLVSLRPLRSADFLSGNGNRDRGNANHQSRFRDAQPSTSTSRSRNPSVSREKEEELAKLLECPVCYSIPDKEVINCSRGHSICRDCAAKVYRCVLCTAPYIDSRNFMMESLIEYFRKYSITLDAKPVENELVICCPSQSEGCKFASFNSRVVAHYRDCQFRPFPCTVSDINPCPHQGKISEYFHHLRTAHRITGQSQLQWQPSGHFSKVDRVFMGLEINSAWPPYYLEYDGRKFIRQACIRNRDMYWWIQLIGPDGDARKYSAVISLRSPDKPPLKTCWTVPVHPIRSTKDDVMFSHGFASISIHRLADFCSRSEYLENSNATHTWTCYISLHKVA